MRDILKEVRYIPHMGRDLILVGKLQCIGFTGALTDGVLKCLAPIALKATRNNNIYIMFAEAMGGLYFTITNTKHTQKWHDKLAHSSVKGFKFLNNKGVWGKDQMFGMPF